ncbi:MAG TPA: hypothetical protein VFZ95_04495, partial [Steroidobacteraceae bacterium]
WPTLLLLGAERVRIAPGITTVTPLDFEYYPISHSLLAVVGWAVLVGGIHFLLRREGRAALVVGALVLSHWWLDLLVHRPDLPLAPGESTLVGLGAWSSLPLTLLLELALFVPGVWLYVRATAAKDRQGSWALWSLVALLLAIYGANLFGSPPPGVAAIAWAGQLQWLLVAWAFWVDRHRRVREPA